MFAKLSRGLTYPLRLMARLALKPLTRLHLTHPAPELQDNRAVFYLLPRPSLTEELLLQRLTQQVGLPGLQALSIGEAPPRQNLIFLEKPPAPCLAYRGPQMTGDLESLWQGIENHPEAEFCVIPVSFFWGRAPSREASLLKLITADTWAWMGRLQRVFALLLHGRQIWVEFGPVIHPEMIVSRSQLAHQGHHFATQKSQRLLQRYFRRVRSRTLGPDLSHRRTQVKSLMASPAIQQAIKQASTQMPPQKAKDQALKYINEIASNVSYPVLLILDRLLSQLWNRLYDGVRVHGLEAIREKAGQHTLVYLPCHRSHIDYLLLSYVLFKQGLMPPHIAAGVNLNMPLIGPFLRRGGAFFMRRRFKDNPLYSQVFNEYLYRLLSQGHPVEFFIEGGRSRTGRTLPPKTGLLAMVLKAAQRGTRKPLLFVPVYIGYEKVLEGATYLGELQGKQKKKESPLDLLRVIKNLRQPFGLVDVCFGESFTLTQKQLHTTDETEFRQCVDQVAQDIVQGINQAANLNRVNLVALALLASSHRALEKETLISQLEILAALAAMVGDTRQPPGKPEEWIAACEHLGFIEKVSHPMGDIYRCDERQGVLLTYYRNNLLHKFALQSLAAFLFINQTQLEPSRLELQAISVFPLLADELMLNWKPADFSRQLEITLRQLAQLGLVFQDEKGLWHACLEDPAALVRLRLLGQLVQPALERVYLLLALLEHQGSEQVDKAHLIQQTCQLAQRLTLLQGMNSPEFSDQRLFDQAVDRLVDLGWLKVNAAGLLGYDEQLIQAMRQGRRLFDPQLRSRLLSLTEQPMNPINEEKDPT